MSAAAIANRKRIRFAVRFDSCNIGKDSQRGTIPDNPMNLAGI